jgi:hypothetical protein
VLLVLENIKKSLLPYPFSKKSFLYTFLHRFVIFSLVSIAWVFFRATDLAEAITLLSKITDLNFTFYAPSIACGLGFAQIALCFLVIFLLLLSYLLPKNLSFKKPEYVIILMCFLIFLLGRDGRSEFIYFQF